MDAFYHRGAGEVFEATDSTTSPWDPRFQHGGPPLALIARLVDERFTGDAMRIARISLEILGPIPKIALTIETRVLRPGKRVKLIEATVLSAGKAMLVANVWRFAELGDHAHALPSVSARPGAALSPDASRPIGMWDDANGYFRAFEWRAARGSSKEIGPATIWARTELALVAGEPTTPRDVLLALSDSANGISFELPLKVWLSIPTSVTVSLARDPAGDWMSLDANTFIGPDGRGVTTGILGDVEGEVGNIVQSLLVSPR